MKTEKILVDQSFIRRTVEEYSDMIVRIAYHHVHNIAEAEDVMQDVFLSIMRQESFESREHLKAWLIRVTINLCKSYSKSARISMTQSLGDREIPQEDCYNFHLWEAIDQLSKREINILYLFYFEGYSAAEIAALLKMHKNAVFTRLSRIRAKLKNFLTENEE